MNLCHFLDTWEGLRSLRSQQTLFAPPVQKLRVETLSCRVPGLFLLFVLSSLSLIFGICLSWGGSLSALFCTKSSRVVKKVRKGTPLCPRRGMVNWIPSIAFHVCPTILHFSWLFPDPSLHSCLGARYKLPCCLLMQDVRHYTPSTDSQGTPLTTSGL